MPHLKTTDPAIKEGLFQYRSELSEQFCDSNAILMVGLEVATGLTDYVIDTVSMEAHMIHTESDLIKLGVPPEHAPPILNLIQSQKK